MSDLLPLQHVGKFIERRTVRGLVFSSWKCDKDCPLCTEVKIRLEAARL